MQIRPANLIPQEFVKNQEYEETCRKLRRLLVFGIFMLLLFVSIIAGIYYYMETNQDMDVPPEIKNEYLAAQKNNDLLQKKKELFQKAKSEDCRLIDTLHALLIAKPDGIKFTRLEISNTIRIEGFGTDPSKFNGYVAVINENKSDFPQAVVEKISSVPNQGLKTFSIKIARSKVNEKEQK